MPNESLVPLERVSKFIRLLTHDVRNGLSAIDLETAFIAEIATEPEVLDEIRKLREMVADTAQMLRRMSQNFQPVMAHPIPWAAATVMEELRKQLQAEFPEEFETVVVENRFGADTVQIDLNQTLAAALAVLRNAFQFRQEGALVQVIGCVHEGQAMLEVREPKETLQSDIPPEQWGTVPLRSTRSGGYGLGLYRARQIAEAQGGSLKTSFTGSELVTQITLPNGRHD
ncbi:MAG: hypothetical protein WCO68_06140 [Verrucomicrobiota bacterium]